MLASLLAIIHLVLNNNDHRHSECLTYDLSYDPSITKRLNWDLTLEVFSSEDICLLASLLFFLVPY